MSAISKDIHAAQRLAVENKWNDIFEGTKFSIYGIIYNTDGVPQSGIDRCRSKWITATNIVGKYVDGFGWDSTKHITSQLIGTPCIDPTRMSFKNLHNNPNNYLVSYKGDRTYAMFDYTANNVDQTTQWKFEYDSLFGEEFLVVRIAIRSPLQPLISGSIGTYPVGVNYSIFGIYIIEPGPKLTAEYCSAAINLNTSLCIKFCSDNPTLCHSLQSDICMTPEGIETPYCRGWCKTNKDANCNIALEGMCSRKLQELDNNVQSLMNSEYADDCGCFLSETTMNGYAESIQNTFNIHITKNVSKCYYPPCSLNANSTKPYEWKHKCGNCPKDSGCIVSSRINISGSLISPPVINQSSSCVAFNKIEDFEGRSATAPMIPNRCKTREPEKTKVKTKSNNSSNALTISLVIGLSLLVLGGTSLAIYKSVKHKK